jgi:acetolactate synthase-1/3 small subunit
MARESEAPSGKPHLFSILVENRPGILARVAGLFAARGYNIDNLTVAESVDPTLSRITCVSSGNGRTIEQIVKQVGKLIDVAQVSHVPLNGRGCRAREMMLFRIRTRDIHREEILGIARTLGARMVNTTRTAMDWEITGTPSTIRAFLQEVEPLGVTEMVRSGPVALSGRSAGRKATGARGVRRSNARAPSAAGRDTEYGEPGPAGAEH